MLGAIFSAQQTPLQPTKRVANIQPNTEPPIPKGCKKYFFTHSHQFFNTKPSGYVIIFECIASSDATANKKFKRYLSQK